MDEIGSEFWEEKLNGDGINAILPLDFNIHYTLCGRTALDIIVEDLINDNKIHSVYMPSYCCHTMIKPFVSHNIELVFYNIYLNNEGLIADYNENDCDVVFLIDYFGFLNSETYDFAKKEKSKGKTIIYDMTHSMFCGLDKRYFDYVFGSFKKWIGVNAGFAAKKNKWTNFPVLNQNKKFVELRNKAFSLKNEFIRGEKSIDKKVFLEGFSDAEALLDSDYKYYAPDKASVEKISRISIDKLRDKRIKNARLLMEGLNGFKNVDVIYKNIKSEECPLFVPILIKNERNKLRDFLCNKKIYLPIHWPISSFHTLDINNNVLYSSELSCVCDQRYNEEDMNTIIKAICDYYT